MYSGNYLNSSKTNGHVIDKPILSYVENRPEGFGIFSCVRDDAGNIVDFVIEYLNNAASSVCKMIRKDIIGRRMLEEFPILLELGLYSEFCSVVNTGVPLNKEPFYFE